MKNMKKVMIILIVAIIIAGIAMICVKGFNYDILYSKHQKLNIYMSTDFEVAEVENIAKEVLGTDNIKVQRGNSFGTIASISASEFTEEQKSGIIDKIKEKYNVELNIESDAIVMNVPNANIIDMISNYIIPLAITTIISVVYIAIRFRKQGIVNTLVKPIISLICATALYISIIALVRIPVNELFVILAILVYILTLICNTIKLSKAEN